MIVRITFLSALFVLMSVFSASAQPFAVNWSGLKNAVVNGTSLERDPLAENKGVGTSSQVLFGRGSGNVFEGSIKYVANNTIEIKKIGFVVLDDPGEQVGTLDYGFSFLRNGKVRAFSPDEVSTKTSYNAGDEFKIGRELNDMVFYINGVEVYRILGSIMEDLTIRADLKSIGSSFDNVLSSFETTHFCVRAFVDNVNKTIELGITGAFPPYEYTWTNGPIFTDGPRTTKGGPVFKSFVNGIYTVKITDSQGDVVTRMFSVGEDAVYTNFYESTVTGNTLQTSTGQGWGGATVTNTFESIYDAWAEYLINKQATGKKAFGFSDVGTQIRKPRNIKAGFLVSRDNVQVLFNGNVVLTEDYDDKDALNIQYVGGVVSWFRNGVEIYTADYVANGDVNLVGLVRNGGTLENLTYDVDPQLYVSSVWDNTTDKGTISVDISDVGIEGPFRYVISQEEIPELLDVYSYLTGDLNLLIDQTQFLTGSDLSPMHDFTGLENGHYYVAIFDSQGNRLLGRDVYLQAPFSFDNQTGLLSEGMTIMTSGTAPGFGSVEIFIVDGENGVLAFEISRKNQEREQFFGVVNEGTTVSSYQDLAYGFYMTGRRLFTVENGVLGQTPVIIRKNKQMFLSIEDGILVLKANDTDLATITLPASYTYKVGLGTEKSGAIQLHNSLGFKPKPYRFKSAVLQHLRCDNTGVAGFQFQINALGSLDGSQVTYSVINQTTGEIALASTTGPDNVLEQINTLANGDPLTVGIYVVQFSINGTSFPAQEICFGYETTWKDFTQNYATTTNDYSILSTGSPFGNYEHARSENLLKSNVADAWMEFEPVVNAAATNFFRYTTTNLGVDPPSISLEDQMLFVQFNNVIFAIWSVGGQVDYEIVSQHERIKITLDASQIQFSMNNGTFSYPRPGGTILARSWVKGDAGLNDVVLSYPCPEPQKLYAHLKYKIDGFHHTMKNGEINFIFNQEYDADDLTFNIYNKDDVLVKTQADFSPVSTTNGNNYLTIDVSESSNCLSRGFHYLEVINSKKEKMYLRFFNDHLIGPCIDYIDASIDPELGNN